MTDREVLVAYILKYINLDNTCLTEKEKEEVIDMLYKYTCYPMIRMYEFHALCSTKDIRGVQLLHCIVFK